MSKEKWLINEIEAWRESELIDADTATLLKGRYASKKNLNVMFIMFSIIGALLIGTGVILISARNWEYFPMQVRICIAFLPLAVSQALALYTLMKKPDSRAWRESTAVLVSASVFTAIALVGQIFHLPSDFGIYVLICGLLSLPIMYLLDAASLLIVFYWTIINWVIVEDTLVNALILPLLFALGVLFVYLHRRKPGLRLIYMTWVTVIAGFPLILTLGYIMDCSRLLVVLCYFTILLSVDELPDQLLLPFKIIGTLGAIVTTAIMTYETIWMYGGELNNAGSIVFIGIMLAAIIYLVIRLFKRDKFQLLFVGMFAILCVLRFIWGLINTAEKSFFDVIFAPLSGIRVAIDMFSFISMCAANLIMLAIGVGLMVYGVKNMALFRINTGMAVICTWIVMRFLDFDIDILWRGIVFLILGATFLLVNARVMRAKKLGRTRQEDTI